MSAATFIVLGRTLAPEDFGVVALAFAIILVLTTIGDSGLANYLVRQPDLEDDTIDTVFWVGLGLAGGLAVALALGAGSVASLFDSPALADVLPVLALSMVVTATGSVPAALMRRDLRFKPLALRGSAATLVGSVVAVVAALAGAGVWALVAQYVVAAAVSTIVVWFAVTWRPRAVVRRERVREMFAFGLKLLSIDLMTQSRDRSEDFVLAGLYSTTTLGFWTVASRLVRLVQESGTQVINAVATPTFAKVQSDPGRLFRGYELAMAASGVLLFPTLLFMAVTAEDLIPFVFGEQWATTAQVAQVTAVTAAVGVFSYFDRSLCVAVNKLRAEMILTGFIVATHVAVVILVAPFGLRELAWALLVRQCVTFPVRQVVLHRVVGAPYHCLLLPLRVLAAAVVACAVVPALNLVLADGYSTFLTLILDAAIVALLYPLLLVLLARDVLGAARAARRGPTAASSRATSAR
ncbi:hypothetical protein ASF50_02735 [Nocardioides sp. Leaf307]|nr:hypothetical protein ASF50_02735 [Nocardioides sp. Leaf307]